MKVKFACLVLLSLLILPAFALAGKVVVAAPVQETVFDGSSVYLGKIGPGQKIEISVESSTGEKSVLRESEEANWDQINILSNTLPLGWASRNALIYGDNKTATVTADKNASSGEYSFSIQAIDEYQGTPPLMFNANVIVSKDVLDLSIVEDVVKTQANKTAAYKLRVKNKAAAQDGFVVSVKGIPDAEKYSQTVYLPKNSEKTIDFKISVNEPGAYNVEFTAVSLSSPLITDSAKTKLFADATLLQEVQAAGRGMLLFPGAQQATIYLMGFLANLIG